MKSHAPRALLLVALPLLAAACAAPVSAVGVDPRGVRGGADALFALAELSFRQQTVEGVRRILTVHAGTR